MLMTSMNHNTKVVIGRIFSNRTVTSSTRLAMALGFGLVCLILLLPSWVGDGSGKTRGKSPLLLKKVLSSRLSSLFTDRPTATPTVAPTPTAAPVTNAPITSPPTATPVTAAPVTPNPTAAPTPAPTAPSKEQIKAALAEASQLITNVTENTQQQEQIPAHIHFIHISKGIPAKRQPPPSQDVLNIVQAWQKLHPTWNVTLWDNAKIHAQYPQLLPIVQDLQPMAWIADVLRYFILQQHGGFYFDTDIQPFQNIEAFRGFTAWGICEDPEAGNVPTNQDKKELPALQMTPDSCQRLCNAVIAAAPRHPALVNMARTALKNTANAVMEHKPFDVRTSGPPLWTRHVKQYDVTIFQAATFFPCNWSNKKKCVPENFQSNPNVYGMHLWKKSWK